MPFRYAAIAVLFAIGFPLGSIRPATAQQGYLYGEQNFRNACRPPLKYAAGACVRRCPAGYRDRGGRYCRPPTRFGF